MTDHSLEPEQPLDLEQRADLLANGNNTIGRKLDRLVQIARYYRWSQIARRARKVIFNTMTSDRFIGEIAGCTDSQFNRCQSFMRLADTISEHHWHHASHRQTDIGRGHLVLLNQEYLVGWPFSWDVPEMSHLWRFQLHYHEYLLHSVADDNVRSDPNHPNWNIVWQVIEHWVQHHRSESVRRRADAWHPYCISRRLTTWSWLLLLGRPESRSSRLILESYVQQAEYLHNNLEIDLGGNHLLENLTALGCAGCLVQHRLAESWLDTAETMMQIELRQQILDHGEHFELSPMYHCQVLGNLLRVGYLAKTERPSLSQSCLSNANRMLQFLNGVVHPDGEIPLLGDSGFHEAPSVKQLLDLAKLCGLEPTRQQSGIHQCGAYWIHRRGTHREADFLIFDRGPVAADELPAHGHCDLLNIEASLDENRWFVDSGNYNYESDSMRHYCRASLAHNVITVEDRNQCDIFSKFRMGRRGQIVSRSNGHTNGFDWARASHNGYRRLGIDLVERLIAIADKNCWICADVAIGNRQPKLVGYLHLSPEVNIVALDSVHHPGLEFELSRGDTKRMIRFFGVTTVEQVVGWYCDEFGSRRRNTVFRYHLKSTNVPAGWVLYSSDYPVLTDVSTMRLAVTILETKTRTDWNFG